MTTSRDYWTHLQKALEDSDAADGGTEGRLDVLRIFTRENQREIRTRDFEGSLPLLDLFEELTRLAEAVLKGSLETAWKGLFDAAPETLPTGPFAIVAMGKLGGRELTYRSDLDLIYLYEDPDDQDVYTRLATRVISALQVLTREGTAYMIDTALRPSGNRGTLVSSLASFQEYHTTLGRTWERQALLRARPLLDRPGSSETFLKTVGRTIEDIVYQTYDPRKIAGEIDHLRARMEGEIAQERPGRYNLKTGRGGLVDVEFLVQYLQLVHGHSNPKLRNQNTILALRALASEGILEGPLAEGLERAYLFLRGLETRLRLILERPADTIFEGSETLGEMESRYFHEPVLPRLLETREYVRSAYEGVLKR